ncbi:hypothetical protein [Thioalbus denitrificans]|nr:hypothetical protein [Thioalbus denitrificans]
MRWLMLVQALLLWSCSTTPPRNLNDSCAIFEEKGSWYRSAKASYERWGVPIDVQLAIIHQESRFVDDAKTPRGRLLWVIPWTRLSSAYGYAQATDGTWERYRRDTGNSGADRDDFDDVTDFIGWYGDLSHREAGIPKDDAYRQYLAYHEGQGGYLRGTWRDKAWLKRTARRVADRAGRYRQQLAGCEENLDSGGWLWPF